MQHAGSRSWDLSSRKGVYVTPSDRNVANLSFRTVSNFSCITLEIKEAELILKRDINHQYECL